VKLPRIRPLTVTAVAAASGLVLYFFPVFNPSDPSADVEFPLNIVIGMTLTACFTGDLFGGSGIRGWLKSALGTLAIVFIGANVALGVLSLVEALTAPEWAGIGIVLVTVLSMSQFGVFIVIAYIADWSHLAALGLSTAVVHLVARFERRRM
jgi:hypothetical protein